jgi:hypothetical protein
MTAGRILAWLRGGRGGLFVLAAGVGVGAGLSAVVFRYLVYFFTWLATGHTQFGPQGESAVPIGRGWAWASWSLSRSSAGCCTGR